VDPTAQMVARPRSFGSQNMRSAADLSLRLPSLCGPSTTSTSRRQLRSTHNPSAGRQKSPPVPGDCSAMRKVLRAPQPPEPGHGRVIGLDNWRPRWPTPRTPGDVARAAVSSLICWRIPAAGVPGRGGGRERRFTVFIVSPDERGLCEGLPGNVATSSKHPRPVQSRE
jgi:hypothetical protein